MYRVGASTPALADLASLRAVPDSSWVDLGDGRWCRMNAIAEARTVEGEPVEIVVESAFSPEPGNE
jgi:hypothetical protein